MNTLALLTNLTQWWNALDTPGQIFIGIGAVAGVITVALLVLTIFGLDQGGVADALEIDVDTDVHGDGSLFSTRSITGFFLGFGWVGYAVFQASGSVLAGCAAGMASGFVLMLVVLWIGKSLMKLQSDGTVDFNQAVGGTGTVYITIPPRRGGGGQAQVVFKSRHEVINAISDTEVPLPAGTVIRVKERLAGDLFLVETV